MLNYYYSQCFAKYTTVIFSQKKIYNYFQMIREIHTVNHRKPNSANFKILHKASKLILIFTKFFTFLCCFVGAVIIISPIPIYIVTGERTDIFPLYVPFFDEKAQYEYWGAMVIQFAYMAFGALGIVCSDLLFIVPVLYMLPLVEVFRARVKELNDLLVLGEKAQNSEMVYLCLKNIVKMHQEICV